MNREQSAIGEAQRIRRASEAYFFRDVDRPSTEFVPVRRRQDPEVRRAKAQRRTAAWRSDLDRLRRPEARDIGMALVAALVTSPHLQGGMTVPELRLVEAALTDLEARGFDRQQIKVVLRRLRSRLVEPRDGAVEETETTGPASAPTAWGTDTIF